jgi:hypothetical protein
MDLNPIDIRSSADGLKSEGAMRERIFRGILAKKLAR